MALQKYISKENKTYFKEKSEINANNSKELWKALKSLGMESGKVNQSKIPLKNDGAVQFEPTKSSNIFKDFYSDLNYAIQHWTLLKRFCLARTYQKMAQKS